MVHSLEQGKLAPYVRAAAFAAMIITLSAVYIFIQFKGFRHSESMDSGQVARAVASGEGFTTKFIRPLALWQLEQGGKALDNENFPDLNNQPLPVLLQAMMLLPAKGSWEMSPLDIVYAGDRLLATLGVIFFLLSMLVWYFVARTLFDEKLAGLAVVAMLLTDIFWQFSISGLPQPLLLLLFGIATWLTLQCLPEGKPDRRKARIYLPLAGLAFGLMMLTHGLAFWIFVPWLVFVGFFFRHKLVPVLLAAVVALIVVSPWLVRNYLVSGNPFGLSIYTGIWPNDDPNRSLMREIAPDLRESARGFRGKLRDGVLNVPANLFSYLGLNTMAAFFFASLFHKFKRPGAQLFRWGILLMWVSASVGMALFGLRPDAVAANQLHVLFLPLFLFFGLAFLSVLWNRIGFNNYLLEKVFSFGLVFLVAIPMLFNLFLSERQRIQWPPYIPPFIAVFQKWYEPQEIIASDMPWAVAWYANRKAVLLPESPRILTRMNDYRTLGQPISGLYLTPITGNEPLVSQIYKGAFREWAGLITRPPQVQGFFLQKFTPLPIDGECIIFADRERWLRN
jgi:hypothetical protein